MMSGGSLGNFCVGAIIYMDENLLAGEGKFDWNKPIECWKVRWTYYRR